MRHSDRVLSNRSTRVAPRCIPQTTNAGGKRSHCATRNNYGANSTFGPTRYTRYTIVIQYRGRTPPDGENANERSDRHDVASRVRRRENVHRVHSSAADRRRGAETGGGVYDGGTIASLLEAIRDESPPWRGGVHGGNGVVGCGSYIPAEINSEQRGI